MINLQVYIIDFYISRMMIVVVMSVKREIIFFIQIYNPSDE